MATRRNPSMSDRRLRALLKQLRENPAAPQDFRARVLDRLADDGLLPSRAAAKPDWRQRVSGWLRPLPMGLAAACSLALIVLLRPAPAPLALAQPQASAVQTAARPAASGVRSAVAQRLKKQGPAAGEALPQTRPAQVAAPEVAVQQPLQVQAPEAVGAAAQPKTMAVVQVAGVTATVGPQPRDAGKLLPTLGSEVRNNVVRVSQGQPADVHFSFSTTGHVRVDILDRLGRLVAVLYDGTLASGEYDGGLVSSANPCVWCLWNNMTVNGATAASGIYLVRIQTPDYVHIHKLMLIK